MQLFVERAQDAAPGFALTDENAAAIAAICVHLDGLPLAIELAAPRIQMLSPPELLMWLDGRRGGSPSELLTGTARDLPARQRTLHDTVAWSHSLLNEAEQILFRRLAVFLGGCTLAAAEAVCTDEGKPELAVVDSVGSLAENNMLQLLPPHRAGGEPRIRMLETIREFALEQLSASGEIDDLARRHAVFMAALVEEAGQGLGTVQAPLWLARLNDELENVRAALRWCVEHDEAEAGARLVWALCRFWQLHGHLSEGAAWTEALLHLPSLAASQVARAKLLDVAGLLAFEQGNFPAARSHLEDSIAAGRAAGDTAILAHALASFALAMGADTAGRPLIEESVALLRASIDGAVLARALGIQGFTALWQGDEPASWSASAESLSLYEELGDRWSAALPLYNRALLALRGGDHVLARALLEENLALSRDIADNAIRADVLIHLARLLFCSSSSKEGDYRHAAALFQEALALARRLGARGRWPPALEGLAEAAMHLGQPERAARLASAAEALRETIGAHVPPSEQEDHDRLLATLRASLDDATFAASWEAGRTMTADEAGEEY